MSKKPQQEKPATLADVPQGMIVRTTVGVLRIAFRVHDDMPPVVTLCHPDTLHDISRPFSLSVVHLPVLEVLRDQSHYANAPKGDESDPVKGTP